LRPQWPCIRWRRRDRTDERRLALLLAAEGARRVAADSVLDPERLDAALATLSASERDALVLALERVAAAGAAAGPPPQGPGGRRRRARPRSGSRLP
jgi:hypothetical protein